MRHSLSSHHWNSDPMQNIQRNLSKNKNQPRKITWTMYDVKCNHPGTRLQWWISRPVTVSIWPGVKSLTKWLTVWCPVTVRICLIHKKSVYIEIHISCVIIHISRLTVSTSFTPTASICHVAWSCQKNSCVTHDMWMPYTACTWKWIILQLMCD
jgi:hypothetical protein